MKNYQAKFEYLARKQGYRCPIGLIKYLRDDRPQELHHTKVHNTKIARKKFPLFIDSVLNLTAVNHTNHMNNPSWGISTDYICEKYERFLERHPKICNWVNNPTEYT